MSLVKDLLLEKKIVEAQEEVEQLLEKAGVESGSCLQSIEFDSNVFTDEDQVYDYLKNHYLEFAKVEKSKKGYKASLYDEIGFIDSTMKNLEVRNGITINIGILKPMEGEELVVAFDIKEESVQLSDSLPSIIQLAKVIKGFHFNYGEVEITKQHLKSFKNNFDSNAYGVDLSIDFDHETREAAGWVKEVFLSVDETELFGVVRWTPKGALALNDREFRYFSPEFNLNYIHPHSGKNYGPTLMGGALVNRPFLKMDAIVGFKDKHKGDLQVETIAMSEHKAKVSDLEKNISDLKLSENTLKTEKEKLEGQVVALSDEVKTIKAQLIKKESEAQHQKLFDEGKINAAQLKALNEGKDMVEILSLSEKMNQAPEGGSHQTKQVQLSDAEMKLCKLMDLSPEEYIKFNSEGGQ